VKLTVKVGEVPAPSAMAAPASAPQRASVNSEAAERALSHPEVQRFQELFPGQVRTVRNLKESES
jgi:hypothetical protein